MRSRAPSICGRSSGKRQRLARLVNNAPRFQSAGAGPQKIRRETLDLTTELKRLRETHGPRIGADAGLALHTQLPEEPLTLTRNRDAFEQIVLNLIDNACKYAAEGGELLITAPGPGRGRRGGEGERSRARRAAGASRSGSSKSFTASTMR